MLFFNKYLKLYYYNIKFFREDSNNNNNIAQKIIFLIKKYVYEWTKHYVTLMVL